MTFVVTAMTKSMSYRRFTAARRVDTSAQVRYIPHPAKLQRTVMCIGTAMEIRVAVCTHITTASVILVREQLNIWRLVNVTHPWRRIIQESPQLRAFKQPSDQPLADCYSFVSIVS